MAGDACGPDWGVRVAAAALAVVLGIAALAPVLAPYDPTVSGGAPLLPPGAEHLLGTNDIGQDVLSEWLWGARTSVVVALLVALLSTGLAWGVGIAAALWRPAEAPLMAVTDLLLALPPLPVYLLIVALVGASREHVILTLGLLSWPTFARIVRAQAISLRGQPYVEAARALGASPAHIGRVHLLPGTASLLPAKLVITVRFAVFAEATLAFLGLGDPAVKSWGTMLGWAFNDPLLFSGRAWTWWVLPPAFSIVLVVLATTWLASGLERARGARHPVLGAAWAETSVEGAGRVSRLDSDERRAAARSTGRQPSAFG